MVELIVDILLERFAVRNTEHFLMVTSRSKYSFEVCQRVRINRKDLSTEFDEADYIICHQIDYIIYQKKNATVDLLCGHTNVLAILCNFVQ